MDFDELNRFDLHYPGHWIAGSDRDWAGDTSLILSYIDEEFVRAVSSYAMFEPVTAHNVNHFLEKSRSKYASCLNGIYATSFVISLDTIAKLLNVLRKYLAPPNAALRLILKYESTFGHLKHIRDSIAHIEDRGRGVDKNQKRILSNFLVLGAFNESCFEFTGSDGTLYGIEISEPTLMSAYEILQGIINVYYWE
jgi:hypothetical protein